MNALHRFYLPLCRLTRFTYLSSVQLLLDDRACFSTLYMDHSLLQAVLDQIIIVGTLHEMTLIFLESVFLRSCSLTCSEHILGAFRVLNFLSALWQNTFHFLRSFWWEGKRKNEKSGLLWIHFYTKPLHRIWPWLNCNECWRLKQYFLCFLSVSFYYSHAISWSLVYARLLGTSRTRLNISEMGYWDLPFKLVKNLTLIIGSQGSRTQLKWRHRWWK